jgi:hypothetical protein
VDQAHHGAADEVELGALIGLGELVVESREGLLDLLAREEHGTILAHLRRATSKGTPASILTSPELAAREAACAAL